MIELTLDQARTLSQAGDRPTVIDPITQRIYALVPEDGPVEMPVEPWKHLWPDGIRGGSNSSSRAST